jgi:hypothetical protein
MIFISFLLGLANDKNMKTNAQQQSNKRLCFEFVETTATFVWTTATFVKVTFVGTTAMFVKTMSLRSRDEREPALHSGAFGDHKSANSEKKKIEKMRKLLFFTGDILDNNSIHRKIMKTFCSSILLSVILQ